MTSLPLSPLQFGDGGATFKGYAVDWKPDELLHLLGEGRIEENEWRSGIDRERAESKLRHALSFYIGSHLRSISGRPLVWVASPPLLGHTAFGLIDRGTNVIQVRPISGCNLSCIFCSVDEGPSSKTRLNDFVVDCDLLLDEFRKLAELKGEGVEAHIDGEGEPSQYHDLLPLVEGLRKTEEVEVVSMQSNGTLLSEERVAALKEAGLTRLNLSVHTLDPDKARRLCGKECDIERVKRVAEATADSGMELLIAPVWLPGLTDDDIPKIVEWAGELGARTAVQNLLHHRFGRNLKGRVSFSEFREKLGTWEKETGEKLFFTQESFGIERRPSAETVMKKGEVVEGEIVFPGRLRGSSIAKARGRLVQLIGRSRLGEKARIRIVKSKSNLYTGKLL